MSLNSIFNRYSLIISFVIFCFIGQNLSAQNYTGVFQQTSNKNYKHVKDLDWQKFNQSRTRLAKAGYQLRDVETRQGSSKVLYSGTFRKESVVSAFYMYKNYESFRKKHVQLMNSGYQMIDFDAETYKGTTYFTGVWKKNNKYYQLASANSWASFTKIWDAQSKKHGMRLVDIVVFKLNGKQKYMGIFHKGSGAYYLYSHSNWDTFTKKWSSISKSGGARLVDFEKVGSQYIGVFVAGKGGHYFWHNVSYNSFLQKRQDLAKKGIQLVDFDIH